MSDQDIITRKAPRWAWEQIDRTMSDVRDSRITPQRGVPQMDDLPSGKMRANVQDAMLKVEHVGTECAPTKVFLTWEHGGLNLAFRLVRHPHRKPDTVLECRQSDEPGEDWHSFESEASSWERSDTEVTTSLALVLHDLASFAQNQYEVWNYPKELESINGMIRDIIAIMGGNITIRPPRPQQHDEAAAATRPVQHEDTPSHY